MNRLPVAAVALSVTLLAGCALTRPTSTPTAGGSPSAATSPPSSTTAVLDAAAARSALGQLVEVAKRPYVPGYQRSCATGDACSFGPAWTDDTTDADGHNGCDTRSDVIRTQMTDVVIKAGTHGCYPLSGTLHDPYTGTVIKWSRSNSDTVEIDHVVPLELAWDLGAARWTQQQRTDYANDPLVLLAVDKASNQAKSAAGPGEWMPPDRSYWCAYDERFVTVLATYRLEVTAADKAAMTRALASC